MCPVGVPAWPLPRPGAAGRRGGLGQALGRRRRPPPGRASEWGSARREGEAARPRPGPARAASHGASLSLPFPPSASLLLRASPPAMGPDSPCPSQCPAGWGKMPKWRPATTLDSPTAGRRRRRLRPSIGNGSPPSPSSPPARPSARIPPTRRPHARRPPVPPPSERRPAAGRAPRPRPARGGQRPRWGRERETVRRRASRAFGGPAAKMASRGLGAEPPPPPGWEGGSRGRGPRGASGPRPRRAGPHLRYPSHLGKETVGEGTFRGVRSRAAARAPVLARCSGPPSPDNVLFSWVPSPASRGLPWPSTRSRQTDCGCHRIRLVPLVLPSRREVNTPTTCELCSW